MDNIVCLPFISPKDLKAQLQLNEVSKKNLELNNNIIRAIFEGHDYRQLIIISIKVNDVISAEEIITEFNIKKQNYSNDNHFIMLIDLKNLFKICSHCSLDDIYKVYEDRLYKVRLWLIKFNSMGITCGVETINTLLPQYIQDLIGWTFVEKTNIENQTHRICCSAMSCPVAYECLKASDMEIALNAIEATSRSHSFITINEQGISAIVRSRGNKFSHLIINDNSNEISKHLSRMKKVGCLVSENFIGSPSANLYTVV